ncbi:MAG: histidine kinase [Bacteroidota bacterium]
MRHHWTRTKRFFSWKLLVLLATYAIGLQLVIDFSRWFRDPTYSFSFFRFFISFFINYPNLLFVCFLNYHLISFLNDKFPWEIRSKIPQRLLLEISLTILIVTSQVILINIIIAIIRNDQIDLTAYIYSAVVGIVINLILITTMEFYLQLKRQHDVALDNEWLKKENFQFKYALLKKQLDPHFLFNSLNSLSSLISLDEQRAKESVRKLSQVYRYVLEHAEKSLVTLEEEVRFVESYIYLLKVRFQQDLVINLKVDPDHFPKLIVPMTLQLLIENAVKHNVILEGEPLIVDVEINNTQILVRNPLKPKQGVNSKGIGLRNLKQKYKFHQKDIHVESGAGRFQVYIPLL